MGVESKPVRAARYLKRNAAEIDWRRSLSGAFSSLIPDRTFGEVRGLIYKYIGGFSGIETGVSFFGNPNIEGPKNNVRNNLSIGKGTFIRERVALDASGRLNIGHNVTIGPGTYIITSSHATNLPWQRAGNVYSFEVNIGNGSWLAANVICRASVGEGSIIGAGSHVTHEIGDNVIAYGNPALARTALLSDP